MVNNRLWRQSIPNDTSSNATKTIDKKIEHLSYLARHHPELLTPEDSALS